MVGQMAIAIALPGFNDLGCLVTPIFLLMDHFFHWFSMLKNKENLSTRSLNFQQNAPSNFVLLGSLFICAMVSNASWKVLFVKTLVAVGIIYATYLLLQNMTMMFSSIDLPLMFLTINLCRPCWIMCTNFSKSGYFPACLISETTVSY